MDFNDVVDEPMSYTNGIWSINNSMLEYLCYCAAEIAMELEKPLNDVQKELLLRLIGQKQVKNLQDAYLESVRQKENGAPKPPKPVKKAKLKLVKPKAEPQ